MKKLLLTAALGLLTAGAIAAEAVKVTYVTSGQGGRLFPFRVALTIDGDQCRITRELDTARLLLHPEWGERFRAEQARNNGKQRRGVTETQYIDYGTGKYYGVAELPGGETIATEQSFLLDSTLVIEPSDTVICGYPCKVATAVINSNTIKYWFTDAAGVRGTIQPAAHLPNGLVLMISRNGNVAMKAQSVERVASVATPLIPAFDTLLDAAMYRHRINNADVITVPVFRDEYIGFSRRSNAPKSVDSLQPDVVYQVGGGTVILKKVKLPESTRGRNIFVRVVQKAERDAYDRTGSIFVIPVGKERSFLDALVKGLDSVPAFVSHDGKSYPGIISTETYDTPVELLRFFTSFGVGGYNSISVPGQVWADSVIYHQDVTHLAPLLEGEAWIGAYIGNWTDKGHKLSLTLKYHPSNTGQRHKGRSVVVPVFNSLNLLEQADQEYPAFLGSDSLRVTIDVPENIRGAQLVYLTTGHGGWGGGDEFNQKENTLYLDGEKIFTFIPWREDCSSYRRRNPASGNFNNGLSSSDLSRSNWCPGTVTNPVYIPLGDLPKGKHTFVVAIPQGAREGKNFSYWCLSGAIVGEAVEQFSEDDAQLTAQNNLRDKKHKAGKGRHKAHASHRSPQR